MSQFEQDPESRSGGTAETERGRIGGQEGEGQGGEARAAEGTQPIGDDAEKEQTQTPSASDDVGVPSDDDISRDDE